MIENINSTFFYFVKEQDNDIMIKKETGKRHIESLDEIKEKLMLNFNDQNLEKMVKEAQKKDYMIFWNFGLINNKSTYQLFLPENRNNYQICFLEKLLGYRDEIDFLGIKGFTENKTSYGKDFTDLFFEKKFFENKNCTFFDIIEEVIQEHYDVKKK